MTQMAEMIAGRDDGKRLTGGEPLEAIARDWSSRGIDVETAAMFIDAGCFDPACVKILLTAGVGVDDLVAASKELGTNAGYDHSNGDITVADILRASR